MFRFTQQKLNYLETFYQVRILDFVLDVLLFSFQGSGFVYIEGTKTQFLLFRFAVSQQQLLHHIKSQSRCQQLISISF